MSVLPMSKRIELELGSNDVTQIKDLNLDGCSATEIEGLSNEYKSLETLSCVNIGLTTLNGFPILPELKKLDLSDNKFDSGVDSITKCTNLEMLNISGNKLKDIADLAPLSKLTKLKSLELNNCNIAAIDNYRKEIFNLLPGLKYLDGLDINGEEECTNENYTNGITKIAKSVNKNNTVDTIDCEDEDEDDDEDDDDDEVGLSALQGSKDLDDDEEEDDYFPDDDGVEDDEVDADDTEEELDEDVDDDEEELDESEIANLSESGVTGPRREGKRQIEDTNNDEIPNAKCRVTELDASGDHLNGVSNVEKN